MKQSFHISSIGVGLAAFVMTLAGGADARCAPVAPEAAMAEAAGFLAENPQGIRRTPGAGGLSLAFTSSDGETPLYYVFNSDNGFVIISADDRLPAVLGYSDAGQFDESRLPDNMRDWLKGYSDEISRFIPTPETASARRPAPGMRARRAEIEPLVTTRWNQDSPYNLLCPTDAQGRMCLTGCVATAYAQIIRYHEWPRNPTGSRGGVDFDGTTYNYRLMIDDYQSGSYTNSQAQAVATLMRQCGAAVDMMYSAYASGAYNYQVHYALPVYFKYSPDLKMMWKDYTPYSEWADAIYAELSEGRPVFYTGASAQGGHAFVCDGYSQNDYFHFNWGWGGYEDGYFLLTALNPASGGAGSFEAGYTSQQSIITGIRPGTESAEPTQKQILISGGFYHTSGNLFEIKNDPDGNNLIYNPLGTSITFRPGLKVEAADGRDFAPVYVNCGSEVTLEPFYGSPGLSSNSLPSLPNGFYHVTPVYLPAGETEWQPMLVKIGLQNYVGLTVSNGSATYSNLGADTASSSELLFGTPETLDNLYSGLPLAFRLPVVNVGDGDFMGTIGVSLMDDDDFGGSASAMENFFIPAKSSQDLEITVAGNLPAGKYTFSILDMNGNVYADDYEFTIAAPPRELTTADPELEITDLSPNFLTAGKNESLYFTVRNTSIMSKDMQFRFLLLDPKSLDTVKTLPVALSGNVPGNSQVRGQVRPTDLGVSAGRYLWCVADEAGNPLSAPVPLLVDSDIMESSDGIAYVVTSEADRTAVAVAPAGDPYSGDIRIPEVVDGYDISAIRNNTFTFAASESVELPSTLTSLDPGTFYSADNLRFVDFTNRAPIAFRENIFNPARYREIWLNADQEIVNRWFSSYGWSRFSVPNWVITLTDVTASGLEVNPATGAAYAPYRMNFNTPLSLSFTAPEGKNVMVTVIRNGEWIINEVISPASTFEAPALGMYSIGEIRAEATSNDVGVNELDAESDIWPCNVYTIDGRIAIHNAEKSDLGLLPAGLYIVAGRKIAIRN